MTTNASFFAPAAPEFADRLSKVIQTLLEQDGMRFSCEGSEFSAEEVAAPDGLLPMWVHRAQGLMAKALGGKTAPMAYRIDGAALCGVRPDPQGATASVGVWALFTFEALNAWQEQHMKLVKKGELVPMDEIYKEWHQVIRSRQVPLLPAKALPGVSLPSTGPDPRTGVAGA